MNSKTKKYALEDSLGVFYGVQSLVKYMIVHINSISDFLRTPESYIYGFRLNSLIINIHFLLKGFILHKNHNQTIKQFMLFGVVVIFSCEHLFFFGKCNLFFYFTCLMQ